MTTTPAMTPIEHMHNPALSRINAPIPVSELERRWAAVREIMDEHGVDAIVAHNHTAGIGGMTRWLSDKPAGDGYPTTIVFPRSEPMTMVSHGPFDGDRAIPPDDLSNAGIGRILTTPSFSSASYCDYYDADLALDTLRALKPARVGFVALGQIPYPIVDRIKTGLSGVDFVDLSDPISAVKSVKSPVEQQIIRATAAFQDDVLAYGFSIIEPGMRESEVGAAMQKFSWERGSEAGLYMVGAAPPGQPAMFQLRHTQERVIQEGDYVTINLENSGPGGFFTHVGRNAVLGEPSQQLVEEFELALEGQRITADMLRPGVAVTDVFAAYQEFLREHKLPPERRLYCHGQGYDLVERPLIRDDEPSVVQAGQNIGCHPMWVRDGVCTFTNDNYLVQAEGAAQRIHAFPQRVVRIG